ncbi:threonine/homoserine/homoserine lactone efflux protein [Rhizobium sp. BK529]|uniref:LysE family translocator n=1 Tax=unclassified Rhizobium TaxID=2613769 RepID=UPI00104533C9|nr:MULTISPECIES: LysE family translocator [unclassified Rhizobium]MBB3591027.1 threonine/homoserine/homoserine lactone efflux protein [Rhizobium sp. BK529]TCS09020.1 threonine/homoserine/homoserine lactone efflux protein [Rhizobium sp. BK418]
MFVSSTLIPFFLALLALQLSPGPDMLLVIGRGIGQGRRVAFLTAVGGTLAAGLIQLPLLALGVASIIQSSPLAFAVLRWAGAAYLIWLGLKLLLKSRGKLDPTVERSPVSNVTALRDGMVSNLTNPKVLVFMLAFLPQFVDPHNGWPVAAQLLILGGIQKLSGFVVLALVALGAGGLGDWLSRRPHLLIWQKRFTGLVMLGLGIRLALTGEARPVTA